MEQQQFGESREEGLFEESINLRHYWHIILERRWLLAATFLVVMVLCVIYLFTATPIFSATTRLQIDNETENSMRMESFVMEGMQGQDYLQTQYKNLQSRSLMEMVLDETQQNAKILRGLKSGKRSPAQLAKLSEMAETNVVQRLGQMAVAGFFGETNYTGGNAPSLAKEENPSRTPGLFAFPKEPKEGDEPSREKLLERISGSVSVSPIRLSRLVDVSVESPNRNEAALIANTIITKFLEQDNNRKRGKLTNAVDFLKTEAANLSDKVRDNYGALLNYKKDNDIISLEESQNVTLQALIQAQTDYDTAHSREVSAVAAAGEAERVFEETKQYGTIPDVATDTEVRKIRGDLALAEAELAEILKRYLDKHPKVIEKRGKIESLKVGLADSERRIFDSILNQAELARATALSLQGVLVVRKSEQQAKNQQSIEYYALEREAKQSETMYNLALQRLKETELQEKDIVQNMHVIDLATAQMDPIKPKKMLTLFLGIVGGLGAGFGLAFFVNFLDDSIKSQDDVEAYLKLPFLGYIPNIKTTSVIERDLQAHLHPQSNSAESFRTVRAAIALSQRAGDLHVVAVTSTVPAEGKSLVASNHAIVMAQTGVKTLLVDFDLRRPSVHKAFQLQSPRGLSSYLLGKADSIDEIVHHTEVPNLDVICCGAVPNNPSELAGSQRMRDFIEEVRNKYDKIMFDCPPVSAVSDPLMIAAATDGIIFVSKFNKIRREHARKTVQRIQDAGINIVGVCINDLDFEGKDSYYYSYYYYQNRYYASHYKSDKPGGEEGKEGESEPKKPAETGSAV
ncbi:MAG: polysaccharide biosynthesis tyrosine autokinase [Verrucomicrobia bacterium]|nr:polysaccharide biosynthesis tyrosine autokinase [Verrucomicrobiota bacterium]